MSDGQTSTRQIAVAVVECEGRILIGQRPAGAPLAGLWEFPGGKVHRGESPEEAARRECQEETGLQVDIIGQLATRNHQYDHATLRLYFYHCMPASGKATPTPPFRWVARADLPRYEFPPANDAVLRQLLTDTGGSTTLA